MATITVHAGDYKGRGTFSFGVMTMPWAPGNGFFGKSYSAVEIESVEIASEESVKRYAGTVGWGIVGGALLGPVGMLAGLLVGGRGKEVTFVARFKDGKKILATADAGTFKMLMAATF